jgi:hypothetical protein
MPSGTANAPAQDFDVNDFLADEWGEGEKTEEAASESPATDEASPAAEAQAGEVVPGAGESEEQVQPAAEAAEPVSAEAPPAGEPTPEPAKAEAPQFEAQPFTFKADGRSITAPGAETRVYPDGSRLHVLTDDALRRYVQPHLADRGAILERETGYKRRIAELEAGTDAQNNPVVQSASAAMKFVEDLLQHDLSDPTAADAVLDSLYGWQQQYPVWKAQQERDAERARNAAILSAREGVQAEPDPYDAQRQEEAIQEEVHGGMHQHLSGLLADPRFSGLTQQSANAVWEDARENWRHYVFVAQQDMPEIGVQKGGMYHDFRPLERVLARARERDLAYQQEVERIKQEVQQKIPEVAAVARENAAALGAKRPTATGARSTGARPEKTVKQDDEIPAWEKFKDDLWAADLLADDN